MHYILFDGNTRGNLLPFAHTRAVADVRCGIMTMRERWEHLLGATTGTITEGYLQAIYPALNVTSDCIYINGAVFGNKSLVDAINQLEQGQVLRSNDTVIAVHTKGGCDTTKTLNDHIEKAITVAYIDAIQSLTNLWDIFVLNDYAIKADYALLIEGKKSAPIPDHVIATGKEQIFLEEGAKINAGCIINATTGPVYIGKGAEIMEGAMIRGPLAMCEGSLIKMGAKIYGATTIGPVCKVGGEISNSVFFANSNKGHDGFVGNSVIGEWCNLGADTNTSNLKNNYDYVKIWHEASGANIATGQVFCGLMMGDHSKCGINTMFNTGTVVGVSSNIYGGGFPDKYIPSFAWGGSDGFVKYDFDKAMETANRMMGRRNRTLTEAERVMLAHIYKG